jgi:hypothetical protein
MESRHRLWLWVFAVLLFAMKGVVAADQPAPQSRKLAEVSSGRRA